MYHYDVIYIYVCVVCVFVHAMQNERTALHLAAEAGHLDIVDKLLQMGAQIQKKDKVRQARRSVCRMEWMRRNRYLKPGLETNLHHSLAAGHINMCRTQRKNTVP